MAEWHARWMDVYDARQWNVDVDLLEMTSAAANHLRTNGLTLRQIEEFMKLANYQRFGGTMVMTGLEMTSAPSEEALVGYKLDQLARELGLKIVQHFVRVPDQ